MLLRAAFWNPPLQIYRQHFLAIIVCQLLFAVAAFFNSTQAFILTASIGLLVIVRFFALGHWTRHVGSRQSIVSLSVWMLGLLFILLLVGLTIVKAKTLIIWVILATCISPLIHLTLSLIHGFRLLKGNTVLSGGSQ